MKYFTSDLHLFHDNIIKYCHRPCTPDIHYEWIMKHFEHLQQGDELYILGDLIFKPTRENVQKFFQYFKDKGVILYIIVGNHDEKFVNLLMQEYKEIFKCSAVDKINHYMTLRMKGEVIEKLVLLHYPMESWDGSYYGSVHLHGHTHGSSSKRQNRFDVGLDVEHKIYSLKDIEELYLLDNPLITCT